MKERFLEFGQIVVTQGIDAQMNADQEFRKFVADSLLEKYGNCDWGNTCKKDKKANDYAVKHDERILAVYTYPKTNEDIWIITEWDRSVTTILFPSEY